MRPIRTCGARLPATLAAQDSPLAQVALIDLVVKSKDRDCASALRRLATRPEADEAVRQRAQWAIDQLGIVRRIQMKALLLLTISLAPLAAQDWGSHHWRVEDQETIHHSYAGGTGHKLVVDNFAGAIHVTGGGSQIEVTMVRHNRADSAETLADAKREVKLEISEQGGEVKLHQDYHHGHFWRGREGYRVEFDYDIQVPAGTALALDNFNSEIVVKGTSGDFKVHDFQWPHRGG
jgi:hypothetical protein